MIEHANPPYAKRDADSQDPRPVPDRARILLVDDDERNLLALSEVLEPVADIVRATSGRDALRKLLQEEFAVILLDVFMPEMDGYETATLIRQRAQTARIPIIFLSAVNKETEHLMRGYAMGAVDYVFKPVDPLILRSKVSVFVDLFLLRQQVAEQAQEEQKLREEKLRVEAERLSFERELQQTQLRQATILEALPLALYEARVDDKGRLHRRFIGGDINELAGADADALSSGDLAWEDHIVPDDRNELDRQFSGTADSLAVDYRWRRSNGETIHLMEQCVRLPDDADAWVGSIIDITAQRELEQQLVQARKMEALGQLTGGVAHDFNNLLAAVLGGLRLLQARVNLEGREQQIVEQMRHAAEKGAELVRRLMAFARKQELSPAPLDPQELRSSVAALVEHSLGDGVEVEWDVQDEDDLHFFVDQAQLELSLVNLLVNARDAMPEGGKIRIEVGRADTDATSTAAGEYLAIRVSDDGEGMPPEVAAKVTEPFFTTKEAGRGTGLGLSMVAGFVEQSGGELRITSQLAEGTQIEMRLPATRDVSAAKSKTPQSDPQQLGIASVLMVDDEESVRLILSEQLRDLGLEVVAAADGKQAIALLEKDAEQFQFILTDLSMPRMSGRELLAVVRQRWPHIKCAIMTGNPTERETGRQDCGGPVLQKPIDLAELKQLMAAR